MPELPEVETTRRGISPYVKGRAVSGVKVRQYSLRWPIPKQLGSNLLGHKLLDIHRRGKYLLFQFAHGHMLIHLGMSGSLRVVNPEEIPKKHDHVDIVFSDICLRYHDPRRFGAVLWTGDDIESHKLLAHLGPEPLTQDFTGEYLFAHSRKRKKDIKSFIMDSHVVVGVGNIYANEALFSAGIRPTKAAGKVTAKKYLMLVDEIKKVLKKSITQGGTTLKDFVGGDGKPGYFVQQLNVYGRKGKPCVNCGKLLKEIRQSQRSSVYCTQCQK
jgi:formamidopyrimidine-DNA glycosylase